MATTVIATDLALHLAAKGEGVWGTNIFADYQPDHPDDSITVYDMGGTNPQEPPEAWRELFIQVRCKDHATGYEKAWRLLNYIISPEDGLITVGTSKYVAQLQNIPSIYDRDQKNRYLFSFQVVLFKVSGNISDTWLNALVDWTSSVLGIGWAVSPVWPGKQRPCVIWSLSGIYTSEGTGTAIRLHKRFTANVLGSTPDENMIGSLSIVSGLKDAIKLPLDEANKRYLLVDDPRAESKSMTNAQATVTLSRLVKRVADEMPVIASVNTSGNIE